MMKTQLSIIFGILLVGMLICQEAMAEDEVLPVMTLDMPPWFIKGDDGRWNGLGIELGRVLAENAGHSVEVELLPWNRGMEYLKEGRSLLFVNLSKSPQREEFVDFIGVSAFDQTAVMVREENAGLVLATLDDLARPGYLWGLRDNAFYSEELSSRLKNDAAFASHFESVAQFGINHGRVKAGRLIGALGDYFGMRHNIRSIPEYQGLTVLTVPFLPPNPTYFGVSRKLPEEQRRRLRLAYEELARQGAFPAIVEKWIGVGPKLPNQ